MIYRAKSSFTTEDPLTGGNVHVGAGDTAREGHWLLDSNAAAFEPLVVRFDAPVKTQSARGKTEPVTASKSA